jgi:hypothetical protein
MELENDKLQSARGDTKYIYSVYQDMLSRTCNHVLITNENHEIIRIISSCGEISSTMQCYICSNNDKTVLHTIGDIYECNESNIKFPYYRDKFNDASNVLELLSSLNNGGNPGAWAGHSLRMDRDEDGELYGVYEDKDTGNIYSGWVNTHRDRYKSVPRIIQLKLEQQETKQQETKEQETIELDNNKDMPNTIDVLLEYDSENSSEWEDAYKLSYKQYIAYTHRDFKKDIYNRLWHLLHVI